MLREFQSDFSCCGVSYCVHGEPGVYTCRRCSTEIFFKTDAKKVRQQVKRSSTLVSMVMRYRVEGEKGVGDTVERLINTIGSRPLKRFKASLEKLGINCGCQNRKEWLNKRYPYDLS